MRLDHTQIINPMALGTMIAARIPAAAPSIPSPGHIGTTLVPRVDVLKDADAELVDESEMLEEGIDLVTTDVVKDVNVVLGCVIVVTGTVVVKMEGLAKPEDTPADLGKDEGDPDIETETELLGLEDDPGC